LRHVEIDADEDSLTSEIKVGEAEKFHAQRSLWKLRPDRWRAGAMPNTNKADGWSPIRAANGVQGES
jgi:hypothetical protein